MNYYELVYGLTNDTATNYTFHNNTSTNTTNSTKTDKYDLCKDINLPINIPYIDSVSGLWLVWSIAAFFVLLSWVVSFYLIYKHLKYYTQPEHQRYIVRLICMVPLYALYSLLSLVFVRHQTYFAIARDCYEAYALFMFFKLCVSYGGGKDAIVEHFMSLPKLKLTFPFGCWKVQPNELFYTVCKQGMLQYVLIRPIVSIWSAMLNLFDLYDDGSFELNKGYSYASIINNLCVMIALYIVVLFEQAAKELLHPYRPILKFLSVKMVIFLAFWQSIMISMAAHWEIIPPMECLSAADVATGLNNFLMCFEMFLVGLLHIVAYPYELYRVRALTSAPINATVKTSVLKNMVNMMNQADLVKDTLESLSIHRSKRKTGGNAGEEDHGSFLSQASSTSSAATMLQSYSYTDEGGLLSNAGEEPISELPEGGAQPDSTTLSILPALADARQRHGSYQVELDELAADEELLDELDDEDLEYEQLTHWR